MGDSKLQTTVAQREGGADKVGDGQASRIRGWGRETLKGVMDFGGNHQDGRTGSK